MKAVLYGSPVTIFTDRLRAALPPDFDLAKVDYGADAETLIAAFKNSTAVVTVRFDQSFPAPPTLRLVQVPGIGCDEINMDLLPPSVSLCNVGGHAQGCAEYVILGLLQSRLHFFEADAEFRTGSWRRSSRFRAPPHQELHGKTVGLAGYGQIGQTIARHLSVFGVRTLFCNRSKPAEDGLFADYLTLDSSRIWR